MWPLFGIIRRELGIFIVIQMFILFNYDEKDVEIDPFLKESSALGNK
jgi:hypothetical protein